MGPQVHMYNNFSSEGAEKLGGGLVEYGTTPLQMIVATSAMRMTGNTLPMGLASAFGAEFVFGRGPQGLGGPADVSLGPKGREVYQQGGRILYAGNTMFTVNPLFGGRGSVNANNILGFSPNLQEPMSDYFTSAAGTTIEDPRQAKGFLQKYGMVGLGSGLTLAFGIQAYNEGGLDAMPKFIAQEIYANKYGLEASVSREGSKLVHNRFLGSALASRIGGTMGAYMFSGIGFDIGGSVGEFAAGLVSDKESVASLGRMVGNLAGTSIGARIGAYAFSGGPAGGFLRGAGYAAVALGATAALSLGSSVVSTAFSGVYASLRTGFQNKRKMRGLDFAGDTSQMYTQRATTMRQRAVQAMNRSHMNARSAFGQEAQLMHTHRDNFSTYRRL